MTWRGAPGVVIDRGSRVRRGARSQRLVALGL